METDPAAIDAANAGPKLAQELRKRLRIQIGFTR